MISRFFNFLILSAAIALCGFTAQAQLSKADNSDQTDNSVTKTFEETLVKQRINRDKKDHQEMIDRGDEAVLLSNQIEKSFETNHQLSTQDAQKLDKLEKLIKKIRTELGAESDDAEAVNDLQSKDKNDVFENAFQKLKSLTGDLSDKLKETTRFSISVAAIETSNKLLSFVRFLRKKN